MADDYLPVLCYELVCLAIRVDGALGSSYLTDRYRCNWFFLSVRSVPLESREHFLRGSHSSPKTVTVTNCCQSVVEGRLGWYPPLIIDVSVISKGAHSSLGRFFLTRVGCWCDFSLTVGDECWQTVERRQTYQDPRGISAPAEICKWPFPDIQV
jgi:hypothetical protein